MGLAASQARLLTITSRKADCAYQSMALSHQKIALSRDMNIVSAEYQDALTHTKLVYDYYGTGDKSTPLSYGLLMSPSKLNNYMPSPITDPSGRVVLDPSLAAAAKAAGIPQEGLGCTPSSDIRNRFIDGLMENGLITRTTGNSIKEVQYNSLMGFGVTDYMTTSLETISFNKFMEDYLKDVEVDFADLTLDAGGSHYTLYDLNENKAIAKDGSNTYTKPLSIKDLLEGNYALSGISWDHGAIKNNEDLGGQGMGCIVDKVGSCSFWDILFASISEVIDGNDAYTLAALDYAKQQTLAKVVNLSTLTQQDISNAAAKVKSDHKTDSKVADQAKKLADDYVGYVYVYNKDNGKGYNDGYNLNLTNITKAFYTYFAQYMQGLATSDLKVTNTKGTSNFVTDLSNGVDFSFNVMSNADMAGDNLMIAGFYDALFNQIATKGWVANDKVNDNQYLQTMLKNGSMYISSIADDDYYYQANYATNTYIKEVTDEEGIALAEAKYNREKAKISSKENTLDMKMKNLDTEINSLNAEYESVKSVITNAAKNSFSRYQA